MLFLSNMLLLGRARVHVAQNTCDMQMQAVHGKQRQDRPADMQCNDNGWRLLQFELEAVEAVHII